MFKVKTNLNILSGLAIGTLTVLFAAYFVSAGPGLLTLVICSTLLLLFCLVLWRSISLFEHPQTTFINPDYMDTQKTMPVLIACIEYTAALHLLLALGIRSRYPDMCIIQAFITDLMNDIDVRGYQHLAEHWYVSGTEMPFFSAMVRAFAPTGNFFFAAMAINALCIVGAGLYLYRLVLLDYDSPTAKRAIKYMYIFPSAFFFAVPLAGGICLFFSVLFVYLVRKRYYHLAALAGFCAALSDVAGTLAIIVAIAEAANEWRARHIDTKHIYPEPLARRAFNAILPSAGILSGLGCYLYVNYLSYGNIFYFLGRRHSYFARDTWYFWETAAYLSEQTKVWLANTPEAAFVVSIPNLVCMFAILLLLTAGTMPLKGQQPILRPSYMFYGLVYFLVVFGVLGDLNAPRTTLALFPIAIAAAALTRKKAADICLTLLYLAGFGAYFYVSIL